MYNKVIIILYINSTRIAQKSCLVLAFSCFLLVYELFLLSSVSILIDFLSRNSLRLMITCLPVSPI